MPYAFGALYNHPVEGFLLDTLGALIAYKVAGMSTRQGMWFFTGCTFKTVDDHCGYALPWDPLQHLTSNNAGYHDIHHQSWGIKVLWPGLLISTRTRANWITRQTSRSLSLHSGIAGSVRRGLAATPRLATSVQGSRPNSK